LCFALALWNGRDSILKERAFGLTGNQGNHGEDVKEYYFYVDATPSHSWMRYLYEYPQAAYPYAGLVEENRHRSRHEPAFNLLDTGVFDVQRYWGWRCATRRPRPRKFTFASSPPITGRKLRRCIRCRRCGIATPGRGARWWTNAALPENGHSAAWVISASWHASRKRC
jgi:hypothetical protein